MNLAKRKPKFTLFIVLLLITAVVFAAIGFINNKLFGKPEGERENNSFSPNELTLDYTFTIDEIVEYLNYEPLWIKSGSITVNVNVNFFDGTEHKAEDSQEVISYDEKERLFKVRGIGKGKITIYSNIDETVSLVLPYETVFESTDTEEIIKYNYPRFLTDDVVTSEELKSISYIELNDSKDVDLSDFAKCRSLSRVYVSTDKNVVKLYGKDKLSMGVKYYVNSNLYYKYMNNDSWSSYENRVFPLINIDQEENTVVFECVGGNISGINQKNDSYFLSVKNGSTIELDKFTPEKVGHTFLGWFTSPDGGKTLDIQVTGGYRYNTGVKLYANWKVNQYSVVYKDEYVADTPSTQIIKYGENFEIHNDKLLRNGYTFLGWSTKKNSSTVEYTMGEKLLNLTNVDGAEIVLYGVWTANTYNIEYNPNGGENAPATLENVIFGTTVQLSNEQPTREGYSFLGWSKNKNASEKDYSSGEIIQSLISNNEGKVTLYAVWAANKYSIHFDANGGQNAPTSLTNLVYGKTVSLPNDTPTKSLYVFAGWSLNKDSTSAEWGKGAQVSNLASDQNGNVTLYAIWTVASFSVTFDANGGFDPPAPINVTCNSGSLLPAEAPTKTGHTFKGWSLSGSGAVYAKNQYLDASIVNSMYQQSNMTFYAVWEVNYYSIKINATSAKVSISGTSKDNKYAYGTEIKVTVKYSEDNEQSLKVDGKKVSSGHTFTMPDHDVEIEAYSECIATGSLVMLADGTQKPVEELTGEEILLAWDFKTGKFVEAPIAIIFYHGDYKYDITNLHFEDGTTVRIIGSHGFFDRDINDFVYIDNYNYEEYIGHYFAQTEYVNGEYAYTFKKLVSAEVTVEVTGAYSVQTAFYDNFMVGNMFSLTPPTYPGFFGYFEMGENMQYDQEKMERDIALYGLYTYEEWSDYLTYEQFIAFNGPYLKVAVGKGLITEEQIINLILQDLGEKDVA